jgi:hypothetical protein
MVLPVIDIAHSWCNFFKSTKIHLEITSILCMQACTKFERGWGLTLNLAWCAHSLCCQRQIGERVFRVVTQLYLGHILAHIRAQRWLLPWQDFGWSWSKWRNKLWYPSTPFIMTNPMSSVYMKEAIQFMYCPILHQWLDHKVYPTWLLWWWCCLPSVIWNSDSLKEWAWNILGDAFATFPLLNNK